MLRGLGFRPEAQPPAESTTLFYEAPLLRRGKKQPSTHPLTPFSLPRQQVILIARRKDQASALPMQHREGVERI